MDPIWTQLRNKIGTVPEFAHPAGWRIFRYEKGKVEPQPVESQGSHHLSCRLDSCGSLERICRAQKADYNPIFPFPIRSAGDGWMLGLEDCMDIRSLHQQGLSVSEIAHLETTFPTEPCR